MKALRGTGVALVTPFNKSGSIDFNGLERLLIHTAKGVDYYVVMGTTGESATLDSNEKKQVLEFVRKHNPKKLPIVYGIGGNNTKEVINNIQTADLRGVSAILSVSPYYNKPSQEGIYLHFKAIAESAPLPIILYNVPGRTSSNITAATTLRLSKVSGIAGIKEASGNLEQCMRIARAKPKGFMLISGDDLLAHAFYCIGGEGVISVLANALPGTFKAIKEKAYKGDISGSAKEQFKLLDINGPMYDEGNPVGVKVLLKMLGVCYVHTRLPLAPPTKELIANIKSSFKAL